MNYLKILSLIRFMNSLNCFSSEIYSCNYNCDELDDVARIILLNENGPREVVLISPFDGLAKAYQLYEGGDDSIPLLRVSDAESATAFFQDTIANVVDDMLIEIPESNEHFIYGKISSVEQFEIFPQYKSLVENYLSFHPKIIKVSKVLFDELSKDIANLVVTQFTMQTRFHDSSTAYFSITYRLTNGVFIPQATFLGTTP